MEKKEIISKLIEAIKQNKGDNGRNQYLIKRLRSNRPLINSDKQYLEKILELKIVEVTNVIKNEIQQQTKK